MSNVRAALGKAAAAVVYYAFIHPYYLGRFHWRKFTTTIKIRKATREAIRLHAKDGRKRFIVPIGRKYLVMDRTHLKDIVNQYRRKHGGQFVSWQKFYIASVG